MTTIHENIKQVRQRIADACEASKRPPESVSLVCVSKTVGADLVRAAFEAGERQFGENYVQEGLNKISALSDLRDKLEWHLIGPLQSNKTKAVAEQFDWVQSIDRLKIAQRLSEQRPAWLKPLNVCLQVNISGEDTKSGIAPMEVIQLARELAKLPRIKLRGLMAIPSPLHGSQPHKAMLDLFRQVKDAGIDIDTLSIGMSSDLEDAIASGSNMVRVGTSIFGNRQSAV